MRRYLFPATQLASAGLAFVAWAYLSYVASPAYQSVPIRALTIAAPLSLAVTLGVTYVLPNEYRGTPEDSRNTTGAWSNSLTLCALLGLVVAVGGAVVSMSVSGDGAGPVLGGALAMAGLFSLGVLCAQVGRATGRFAQVVVGAVAAPLPPLAWVVVHETGGSAAGANRTANVILAVAAAISVLSLRHALQPLRRSSWAPLSRTVLGALPLVPHLLCFGLIVQGIRLPASWSDDHASLLVAHRLMLCASIGFTLLASFNSFFSVTLQTSSRADYRSTLAGMLRRYWIIGVTAALLVLASAIVVAHNSSTSLGSHWLLVPGFLMLATANVAFYYSLSAQLIRRYSTIPLALSSASTLSVFLAWTWIAGRDQGLVAQSLAYAVATLVLPATPIALGLLGRRHADGPGLAYGAAIIYPAILVPSGVILATALL